MAMIKTCQKPPVYFESTTGSFYSQYAGLPLKSCRVDLPVNQSGSGTPSPTNIRDFIPYTALDFTANSITRTFTFGQDVYIGYLDILTGELTVTSAFVDMGSLNWNKYGTDKFYTTISDIKLPTTVAERNQGIWCSIYKPSTGYSLGDMSDKSFLKFNQDENFWIYDSDYTDATAFKTAVDGVQLVYELVTPITIPLGGEEINTILGLNSLSSSVGTISAEYLKAGR